MSEILDHPPSRHRFGLGRQLAAWGVHAFTASGAAIGAVALIAIIQAEYRLAIFLMLLTMVIDSIDGTFARVVGVSQVLPRINGRRLDDIVDFLNFVIVPCVFMAATGSVPHTAWIGLPVLASCYGFTQEDAKTADNFFLGWPSYWNVLAIYLWVLGVSPLGGALWVLVLSIAIFVPLKYIYPSKLASPVLRYGMSFGGLAWSIVLGAGALFPDLDSKLHLSDISLVYLVIYMGLSMHLGNWREQLGSILRRLGEPAPPSDP
jgi:phosphatidylcholine synthase